jgi:hypothetical protein
VAYQACEDCGCRMYGGICSNCQEELYILENQAEYRPEDGYSDEFLEAAGEQLRLLDRRKAMEIVNR